MIRFVLLLLLATTATLSFSQSKKLAQPDLPGDIMLDVGLNYWTEDRDTLRNWGSKSLGIYYTKRMKISNKLSFYPAVGLTFEKFAFKRPFNYTEDPDNNQAIIVAPIDGNVTKNKLAVTYFEVPLELRFHPKGTIDGEGLFVGAGVIGGLKMRAHTKVKYSADGDRRKEKLSSNFGLQDYRYGYQFRVGWKGVHFFYKRYLSTVYREDQQLVNPDGSEKGSRYNPALSTFGINFTGF